jgi:hypothetical protein
LTSVDSGFVSGGAGGVTEHVPSALVELPGEPAPPLPAVEHEPSRVQVPEPEMLPVAPPAPEVLPPAPVVEQSPAVQDVLPDREPLPLCALPAQGAFVQLPLTVVVLPLLVLPMVHEPTSSQPPPVLPTEQPLLTSSQLPEPLNEPPDGLAVPEPDIEQLSVVAPAAPVKVLFP